MRARTSRIVQHVRRWPRRVVISLAVVAALLIAARIALPFVVKRQVNARLASIPGYVGHVEGVSISLFRGAYGLHGLAIFRQEGQVREPFVTVRAIDFSIAWRELFRGKVVSDIYLETPNVIFVKAATAETSQTDADQRWKKVIQDLFPIDITHFEIRDGAVRYVDKTKAPHVDVFIKNMHAVATGLRNRPAETGQEFPAQINIAGDTLGAGKLKVFVEADPLAEQPHFHLSAKLDGLNLPALNESMKAIANVDVGKGTFRMAAEMAGKDGGFQGYVKPFFEDLDFRNLEDKDKGLGSRLWEKMVAGLAWLLKNKSRDQLGTRIPFEGRFGDPKIGLWATISNTFRHGFVKAFNPTIEGSVQAQNVRPDGKSVQKPGVKDIKDDTKAGAPTGRTSNAPPKK